MGRIRFSGWNTHKYVSEKVPNYKLVNVYKYISFVYIQKLVRYKHWNK